jgi:hypothetical protein
MALASKPSALLLSLDLFTPAPLFLDAIGLEALSSTVAARFCSPPIPGRHNPAGLGPAALLVHSCPPYVELMNNLIMLLVLFHFGGGFDPDGDFVNYINVH